MKKHQRTERLWCFRRWSRKPWAAFAGLRRLKIGVLSVAMSIILLATNIAGAQTAGVDSLAQYRTMHLDTVQVKGRSVMVRSHPASQTRNVVAQKEAAPLQTAESVLRLLPQADVRDRGGKGVQADISIRGGSFDQTMVMLNGVNFSDARTGHQSHSLPVDIDCIGDIVIRDGSPSLGALSGAVDFRTYGSYSNYIRANLSGGAWGYAYGNLSGACTRDRFMVFGAASYRRSDGYRYNTDFRNVNAFAMAAYHPPKAGSFIFQGGFQTRDWGSNGFYSLKFPDQFEHTRTGLASLKWVKYWQRVTVNAVVSFRENSDRFEMQRGNPDNIPFNYHTTYNAGAEVKAGYDWRRAGTTSLGVDYMFNRLFSTAMGEALSDPSHRIPGQDGFYPKGSSRNVVNGWLRHLKVWNWWSLGGQATISLTPYGTAAAFGAEAGWNPFGFFNLRAAANRSMRLPTFTDLYYNVAGYHPDPGLRPENAMTYRLSADYADNGWLFDAAVYYRRTRDVIDWEQHEDGDWYSTQLNKLGTTGVELTAAYRRGWLNIASISYGYIHSDMNVASGYISKYALDYLRHKVTAMAGVSFLRNFTFTLTGSFCDRMGSYIAADGKKQGYRPYLLLDGRLSWERKWVQLYVDATNITDTSYCDFGGLPMPGIWASGGIVITIK